MDTHQYLNQKIRSQRILYDVTLELTYKCNLDCFFCYNDREKAGKPLSLQQYKVLLDDLADMQTLYLMLTGGEPMVHPHFFDIGAYAKQRGFAVRIRTNGHSLSKRNCLRLLQEIDPFSVEVSLHGGTAQSHDRQTRISGSFDRLLRNIQNALDTGLRLKVVTTPTSWNQNEVDEMFALCDGLGIPLRFQGPVAPRDNGDTSPLSIQPDSATWDYIKSVQRARRQGNKSLQQGEFRNRLKSLVPEEKEIDATCSVGLVGVDIDPYGNVQACMHLQQSAGNIHDQSIREIWDGSPLFAKARNRAVAAAQKFQGIRIQQFGAPLYCLAVEENMNKKMSGESSG